LKYPISTGQAAELLAVTEPQLAELVRRGYIHPAPAIFAGRRLWEAEHLIQAARHLGITSDLEKLLDIDLGKEVQE
jgi:hypothetical protein